MDAKLKKITVYHDTTNVKTLFSRYYNLWCTVFEEYRLASGGYDRDALEDVAKGEGNNYSTVSARAFLCMLDALDAIPTTYKTSSKKAKAVPNPREIFIKKWIHRLTIEDIFSEYGTSYGTINEISKRATQLFISAFNNAVERRGYGDYYIM